MTVPSSAQPEGLTVSAYTGGQLAEALPHVAELRIVVFRDWPYLYDGTLADEQGYLARFARAKDAVIVVARDGVNVIGAATAGPLMQHVPEFAERFLAHGYDPERIFYCGESVLLPAYRGRGLGHAFFDHREAHARTCQSANGAFTHTAFCGVVRPDAHPARPTAYWPLDAFWSKRGYQRIDGLVGSFSWTDIGDAGKTEKPMQYWTRAL